jgi:hypothetical protein
MSRAMMSFLALILAIAISTNVALAMPSTVVLTVDGMT